MAGEWIECRLADACSAIDYGLTASASEAEVGPRFLRITDIVSGHINWKSVPHVAVNEATIAKYRLHDGDIVLARTGASTGASSYVKNPPLAVFASYLVRLKSRPEFDPQFIAYYLKSDAFWSFIRGVLGDKSAQPNASASTMSQAPLRVPRSKAEQQAIAHILGTLDGKIELNQRMSETLEAMAQTIFRTWFVDFEPVRAKMDGRWQEGESLPGLPAHLFDLFPDCLVDSELGEIPEGWMVGTMGEDFRITMGQSPPGSTYNEDGVGLPFYQGRVDFGSRFPARRVFCRAPTRFAEPGDTLVTVRAPVGDVNMAMERCSVGRGVAAVRHEPGSRSYTYYFIRLIRPAFERFEADGTVFGAINKDGFTAMKCVVPPGHLVERFEALSRPLDDQIEQNELQTRTLAALRDALLPKLVSGDIRLARFAAREG
jgi:type I restriction enzyme S subunit